MTAALALAAVQVDNVILRDPPMQSPIFAGLNLLTGNDRTPVPNMFQGCDSTTPDCTDQVRHVGLRNCSDGRPKGVCMQQLHWCTLG